MTVESDSGWIQPHLCWSDYNGFFIALFGVSGEPPITKGANNAQQYAPDLLNIEERFILQKAANHSLHYGNQALIKQHKGELLAKSTLSNPLELLGDFLGYVFSLRQNIIENTRQYLCYLCFHYCLAFPNEGITWKDVFISGAQCSRTSSGAARRSEL